MSKKKILVLPPDTPHPSYIENVVTPLEFLKNEYAIHTLDSLSIMDVLPLNDFYKAWQQNLIPYLNEFDAFFGFSFGGVILQQCFSMMENVKKPVILFSTPSFADNSLNESLNSVIKLCKQNRVDEGLSILYKKVSYPNKMLVHPGKDLNNITAANRVIYGLTRVLETNSSTNLKNCQVKHTHLIGEQSQLVNSQNVVAADNCDLRIVPKAGMRVLRDNFSFCEKVILEALHSES